MADTIGQESGLYEHYIDRFPALLRPSEKNPFLLHDVRGGAIPLTILEMWLTYCRDEEIAQEQYYLRTLISKLKFFRMLFKIMVPGTPQMFDMKHIIN